MATAGDTGLTQVSLPVCLICRTPSEGSANCKRIDCADYTGNRTSAYAASWRMLSSYLKCHWPEITRRGSFDLSKIFDRDHAMAAINIHLHFVNLFAKKLLADNVAIDLSAFASALSTGSAHPEVSLLVASTEVGAGKLISHDSTISVLRSGFVVQSALWTHLAHPIAIKICYLKSAAPMIAPPGSHPWHPLRQRKLVKLSAYKGDTQPAIARRDLRV